MPGHDLQRARAVKEQQHAIERVRHDQHLDHVAPAGMQEPELRELVHRAARASNRRRDVERLPRRGDVVHAKDARAALERRDRRARRFRTRARPASRTPVSSPMNRLRDTPTSTGKPHADEPRQRARARAASARRVFANPIPGSTTMRSRAIPLRERVVDALAQLVEHGVHRIAVVLRVRVRRHVVHVAARVHQHHADAASRRTRAPSPDRAGTPDTSFTMCAPASIAARATRALHRVDRDRHVGSRRASARMTGITRRSSSSASTDFARAAASTRRRRR